MRQRRSLNITYRYTPTFFDLKLSEAMISKKFIAKIEMFYNVFLSVRYYAWIQHSSKTNSNYKFHYQLSFEARSSILAEN